MMTCFQVEQRTPMSRTELKRLRNSGRVPANIYGAGSDNTLIHLSSKEFGRWMRTGENGLVELKLEHHDPIPVVLEAIQRDPVTQEYIHADFLRVNRSQGRVPEAQQECEEAM